MSVIDADSGEVVPDNATQPFPNPGETALDHATEAKSYIIRQYRDATKLQALIAGFAAEVQKLEDCAVTIPQLDDPAIATGVNLDVTGDLVGQGRVLSDGTSMIDATYRVYIGARIARNTSIGSDPQMITALRTIFGATPFKYYTPGGMTIIIEVGTGGVSGGPPSADIIALLDSGPVPRAMGVGWDRAWYDPSEYFAFADDTAPGAKGFGEAGDPTVGGGLSEAF